MSTDNSTSAAPTRHLLLIGAGGNIGSHLVPLLARMPCVGRLTLIDRDVYEARNRVSQDIGDRDVGRAKVRVQATRARHANGALRVVALHTPVELLPLGVLRADVIVSCLDSRRARQYVNEASRRLGVPWVDAGVRADGLLARVTVYSNASGSACMECTWDDRDYASLEQSYPCVGRDEVPTTPTLAPAALGALAAALQALECQRLLSTPPDEPLECREIVVAARSHSLWTTALRRTEQCRLSDHSPWALERLPESAIDWPLARVVADEAADPGSHHASVGVAGRTIVLRLRCAECADVRPRWRVGGANTGQTVRCRLCGGAMRATGFDCADSASIGQLSPSVLGSSLRRLGVRPNDVLTLGTGDGERHVEVGPVSTNHGTNEMRPPVGRQRLHAADMVPTSTTPRDHHDHSPERTNARPNL